MYSVKHTTIASVIGLFIMISSSILHAATGYGISNTFVINNLDADVSNLQGMVVQINADGVASGPLAGATVTANVSHTTTTNANGEFTFTMLPSGSYSVSVSKTGYYPITRNVVLQAGQTRHETFSLTQGGNGPVAYDIGSPNGRHFIEGMPGNLIFETTVAWNGSPGTVYFHTPSGRLAANVTNLGNGLAKATLTIPSPTQVSSCTKLTIEVTNGESIKTMTQAEMYFYPIPQRVQDFYQSSLAWYFSGNRLQASRSVEIEMWKCEIPSGDLKTAAKYNHRMDLSFDPFKGEFTAASGINGSFDLTMDFPKVETMGGGGIGGTGSLELGLRGFDAPTVQGSLSIDVSGKVGLGAPAVLIVDVIFPPASPFMTVLRNTPVVGEIVEALRLRIFLLGGMGVEGHWSPAENSCWLGASSWDVFGTWGVEGQVLIKSDSLNAEAGIYAGGTGTPSIQVCPEWQFQGVKIRGYVGVFASAWLFSYSEEVGWETTLGEPDDASASVMTFHAQPAMSSAQWRPIGTSLLEWGEMNRLVASESKVKSMSQSSMETTENVNTIEGILVENVTKMSSPSVAADATETLILYSAFDPAKPWYQATDIGTLSKQGGGAWSLARIADDTDAEFDPQILEVDSTTSWAAWERVSGDISGAAGPDEIAPHLEIVTSGFNRTASTWSTPIQLTSNSVVDRKPQPVIMDAVQGILWIQNQAQDSIGNSTNGDSLLFAEWDGSQYLAQQTLWAGQKGILSFSFVASASGEGHVVLSVDEDGNPETNTDRELYALSTVAGSWQTAMRLTEDAVEDSVPVLISVNGIPMCVWSADGTVNYTALSAWSPQAVYTDSTAKNESLSLDGVAMPGGAAIAYTVQGPEGMDIVASFYDAAWDKWSLPKQLTHDEHAESSLSLASNGTELVIAYLKTQTERNDLNVEIDGVVHHIENVPQPARTDLYVLRHELGHDLAVTLGNNAIQPANPVPGSTATILATVENWGDLPVEDVQVAFYEGDPLDGGILIGEVQNSTGVLAAGERQEVSIAWVLSAAANHREIFVVVDPELTLNDRNRVNNTTSYTAVLPDLVIEACWSTQLAPDRVVVNARIANTGSVPAGGAQLSWRRGSRDGSEIGTSNILPLGAGETFEVAFTWNTVGQLYRGQDIPVYAVIDPNNEIKEFVEDNNEQDCIVTNSQASPLGDMTANWRVDMVDYAQFSMFWHRDDCSEPDWCGLADFNQDGIVDIKDLAILAMHWLEGAEQEGIIAVPDVVGHLQTDAEMMIIAAGLIVGAVSEEYSDTVAAGYIINQTPTSGGWLLPGESVDLVISKGAEPDLFVENFETGDLTKYPWQHSGNAQWVIVSDTKYEGSYAAKSGVIGDNQATTLEITLDTQFTNISFYRKVSSESGYDYLRFYIDGAQQTYWAGTQDWVQQTYTITPGQHTFKWSYTKDGSVSSGSDCAWIDNITVY